MINISGYGLGMRLVASNTFPQGITIKAFADDADAADAPDMTISDTGVGLNGDLVVWNRANALEVGVNVIPFSEDDINLDILANANRVGKNKASARDVISIVMDYPNGGKVTLTRGVIIVGSVVPGIQSAGRIKTRQYRFRFENIVKTGFTNQEIV